MRGVEMIQPAGGRHKECLLFAACSAQESLAEQFAPNLICRIKKPDSRTRGRLTTSGGRLSLM
jgi:hypothetical protein